MLYFLLLCILIGMVSGKSMTIVKKNSSASIHTLPFPKSVFQHKFRSNHTSGTFTLFEAEYLNEGPGHHLHTKDDELFHILDGNVQFIVNGSQFCASTGDYVYIPRNIPQGIRVYNPTNMTKPVRIQIMLLPAGLDYFLDEIALIYKNDRTNLTAIDMISQKYGIIGLGAVDWKDLNCFDNISTQL